VECRICHGPCESVHSSSRVPSPKQTEAWDRFLSQHRAYKAAMEAQAQAERDSSETKKPPAQSRAHRRSYLKAVCTPLIKTLDHSAALPANQLAGHAANLNFWLSETKHCLA